MKIHNAIVYHCISCGRVEHSNLEAEPPACCGQTMAKACAQTIRETDNASEPLSARPETPPPATDPPRKPR